LQTAAVKSEASSVSAAEAEPGAPAGTRRLVIRVKIISEVPSPSRVRRRLSAGALLLTLVIVVSLSWVGIRMLRNDRAPALAATETATQSESRSESQSKALEAARTDAAPPVLSVEPPPQRAPETPESKPSEVDAPPSPIDEVLPDVPRIALNTIHGTIRVSIRVIVDQQGTVLAASTDDGGPSRYFERLAIEAAKKWTFTPASSRAHSVVLVRFAFTRSGTTARASSVQ
jgi:TonB family protein